MIFRGPMPLECAGLACFGVMVLEMNLKMPAQISWWNQRLILLAPFFRCSVDNSLQLDFVW